MSLFSIFTTALIAENVILTKFLGICSFLGTSNKEKNAIGMGISVTFVTLISTILTYLINKYIGGEMRKHLLSFFLLGLNITGRRTCPRFSLTGKTVHFVNFSPSQPSVARSPLANPIALRARQCVAPPFFIYINYVNFIRYRS